MPRVVCVNQNRLTRSDPCASGTMADEIVVSSSESELNDVETDSSMSTSTTHETSTSTIMSPLTEPVSLLSRLKSHASPSDPALQEEEDGD